jgi:uncharacterized protein YlxW (UPF0749 family)
MSDTNTDDAGTATAADVVTLPDDHPLVKTLAAQKEQLRALKASNADVAEKARLWDTAQEAQKTELEKAQARAEAAEKSAAETAVAALRAQIALDKKLTPSQAKRLVGSTKEELEADADELLADLKITGPGVTTSAEGQGKQGAAVGTGKPGLNEALRALAGN